MSEASRPRRGGVREAAYLASLVRGSEVLPSLAGSSPRALLDLARRHQVSALGWWRLRNRGDEGLALGALDEDVAVGLKRDYQHHRLRNESLARDLRALAVALSGHGVPGIVTKGPWLAFCAYPDPGTRPIGDIDLCVSEQDYERACAALGSIGYRCEEELPRDGRSALRRAHYRRQLRFSARGRRPLELHFRLVNLGPVGKREPWLWDGARPLPGAFAPLLCPGPEAMLIHLLLHANQHGFACLRLLCDVHWALVADRGKLDASRFAELVRRLRIGSSVFHTLGLAARMLGTDPAPLEPHRFRPSALRRASFRRAWQIARVEELAITQRANRLEAPRLYLLEMGSPWDKARYLVRLLYELGKERARRAAPRSRARGRRPRSTTTGRDASVVTTSCPSRPHES